MRTFTLAALVVFALAVPAGAQTDAELMAPIQTFIDSFNKGDIAAAAATHAPGADLALIDEVPPYVWRGPKAFMAWAGDLDSDAKKNGITDGAVTLGTPRHFDVIGDRA